MTKILLIQSAAPKRVRQSAERILAGGVYPEPEITVLCSEDPETLQCFSCVPQLRVLPLRRRQKRQTLRELRGTHFDVVRTFWTGEKRYRRRKLLALWMRAGLIDVETGDGGVFTLTWKAPIRFWLFRLRHPLPTDHWQFVPPRSEPSERFQGERILVVQSAEPRYVIRALDKLQKERLFRNPRYVVFCRNRPEVTTHFQGHPLIHEIRTHSEARNSWRHLRSLRSERFDGTVVFLTGDPSYWKIKYFAFLLGARNKVVFNENNDCFYFSLGPWLRLLLHRLGERARLGAPARWTHQLRLLLLLLIKAVLLPFRFVWLLAVWLRLRSAGAKASG